MPVREVRCTGNRSNLLYRYPSYKMKRMISCESTTEHEYVHLLDFDPCVVSFEEQPLTIEYYHKGRARTYTPDFLVHELRVKALVECKRVAELDDPKLRPKFAAARAWCRRNGHEFRIVTDSDVRTGIRLSNVKRLRPYARRSPHPLVLLRARDMLVAAPFTPIGALAESVAGDGLDREEVLADLLHHIRHGRLSFDIDDVALTRGTPVRLPGTIELEAR